MLKRKTIDLKFLKREGACPPAVDMLKVYHKKRVPIVEAIRVCMDTGHPDWATWLLPRCVDRISAIKMAVCAARSVQHLTSDPRVLAAIEAAEAVIINDTLKNRDAARAAAWAEAARAEAARAARYKELALEFAAIAGVNLQEGK